MGLVPRWTQIGKTIRKRRCENDVINLTLCPIIACLAFRSYSEVMPARGAPNRHLTKARVAGGERFRAGGSGGTGGPPLTMRQGGGGFKIKNTVRNPELLAPLPGTWKG